MKQKEILEKAKSLYLELAGKLSSEDIEPLGSLIADMQTLYGENYGGQTKTTDNLTFTLNYADGTHLNVEKGILFSLDDNDRMDIHVGISKAYQLFGVYLCLKGFIDGMGLTSLFNKYVHDMVDDITDIAMAEMEEEDNADKS